MTRMMMAAKKARMTRIIQIHTHKRARSFIEPSLYRFSKGMVCNVNWRCIGHSTIFIISHISANMRIFCYKTNQQSEILRIIQNIFSAISIINLCTMASHSSEDCYEPRRLDTNVNIHFNDYNVYLFTEIVLRYQLKQ